MQAVCDAAQSVTEQTHLLPRYGSAQHDALLLNATNAHSCLHQPRTRRAAQKDGSRHTATGLHTAKAGILQFQSCRFRPVAVYVSLNDRIPAIWQVINHFITYIGIIKRQAAGHEQGIIVAVFP